MKLGKLRFIGMGKGVVALLVIGALASGYNEGLVRVSSSLFGEDAGITRIIEDMPGNVDELVSWTKKKLGNPRRQFNGGMDGFIDVAREFNPNATVHPSYDRMYESMDVETFMKKVQDKDM